MKYTSFPRLDLKKLKADYWCNRSNLDFLTAKIQYALLITVRMAFSAGP